MVIGLCATLFAHYIAFYSFSFPIFGGITAWYSLLLCLLFGKQAIFYIFFLIFIFLCLISWWLRAPTSAHFDYIALR